MGVFRIAAYPPSVGCGGRHFEGVNIAPCTDVDCPAIPESLARLQARIRGASRHADWIVSRFGSVR